MFLFLVSAFIGGCGAGATASSWIELKPSASVITGYTLFYLLLFAFKLSEMPRVFYTEKCVFGVHGA